MGINNSRPSQKPDENSQLKEENSQLKEENSQLKEENSQLKKENSQLKEKYTQLEDENSQLNQIRKKEKIWLFERNRQLNLESVTLKNKNCHKDCVLCTIVWACGTILGLTGVCGRALEKAIIKHASEEHEINENDLKCEQLMATLEKCRIVTAVGEFEYPSKSEARNYMINKAWDTLMEINHDKRAVILGRRQAKANDKLGHVEICNLKTRVGGKVKIYDPQQGKFSFSGHDKEDFRNYVKDDSDLLLYIVELQKLEEIIKENAEHISH